MSGPPQFLLDHYAHLLKARQQGASSTAPESSSRASLRPHITLTWAQSLDAKIAGPGGSRVILSGPESMLMTHWMRSMHDVILIGVNTLKLDDPRLRINLLPPDQGHLPPRPIIIDRTLKTLPTARILQPEEPVFDVHGQQRIIRRDPWFICAKGASSERRLELEKMGAKVIPVDVDERGVIPPSCLPDVLAEHGLRSVMVEGGSQILSSFLREGDRADGTPFVDSVIVTVAPTFIGDGISLIYPGFEAGLPSLKTVHTETMGKDAVMVATVDRR